MSLVIPKSVGGKVDDAVLSAQEKLIDTGQKTTEGRPIFKNQFGDLVTERSITITDQRVNQGRATNIPTVFNGRFLPENEAIEMIFKAGGKDPITGRLLQGFNSINEAVDSAKVRSKNIPQSLFNKESQASLQEQPMQKQALVIPSSVSGRKDIPVAQINSGGVQQLPQQSQFQAVEVPSAVTGFPAFGRGVERGAMSVGAGILQKGAQALGLAGVDTQDFLNELQILQSTQQAQIAPTMEAAPIATTTGEIVGEAAALPIPARTLPQAFASGAAIGALQFGEKETVGEFAKNVLLNGAFSLIGQFAADKVVNFTKSAANKLGLRNIPDNLFKPDGTLKPESEQFLQKEGININDLSDRVIAEVEAQPEGADIAQALRRAQAKELGVTDVTAADITQRFDDQSLEFNLARQRGTPEAEALRQQKASQNQQIVAAGEAITKGTGGEAGKLQAGQVLQDALRGSRASRKEAITALYSAAEQQAGIDIPVSQELIAREFFDQDFIFGLDPDIGGQLKAVRKQLEAFSVLDRELITSEADIARIRPLTIQNSEALRKNIRALISETDPKSQRALLPLINAIDDSIDSIAISNELGKEAQQAFASARNARAEFGREFEAKDIVQNIVSFKPGTQTDLIPPSIAFDKIMNSQARLENVQAVKSALLGSGLEGKSAWDNFRATAAAELMGKALTTGKTASGDLRFSGANFNKALKTIGNDTLKEIFKPAELNRIRQLGRVSRDVTILQDGVFTPSGAQVENALIKLSRLPLFRLSPVTSVVVNEGAEQLKKGARRRELSKVINPNIDINLADELGSMSNNAVNVLRLLALSGQRKTVEGENE